MPPMWQKAWMRRCARTPRGAAARRAGGRRGRARGQRGQGRRAFMRDCGDNPAYCMYERARALSLLPDAENPLYHSVDAWSFSVPLARAQACCPARLRCRGARRHVGGGEGALGAAGAVLPRCGGRGRQGLTCARRPIRFPPTSRSCRRTRPRCGRPSCCAGSLYSRSRRPRELRSCTAWEGCPEAGGATGYGSIADMEAGGYAMCPACQFGAESMGKVAAASTSIENGFEYHYAAVAQAARDYQEARSRLDPPGECRQGEGGFAARPLPKRRCRRWEGSASKASPPGCLGVVAMVATLRAAASSTGFERSSVQEGGVLGRAGRRLGGNAPARHGRRRALRALLAAGRIRRRRRRRRGGGPRGSGLLVWRFWGAYANGQKALEERDCAGPGRAAAGQRERVGSVGGRRARLVRAGARARAGGALTPSKPAPVNTGHVASADDGAFAARFLGSQGTRACRCRCGRRVLVGCRRAGRRGFRGNGIGFRHGGNSGGRVPRGRHDPARHHRAASWAARSAAAGGFRSGPFGRRAARRAGGACGGEGMGVTRRWGWQAMANTGRDMAKRAR